MFNINFRTRFIASNTIVLLLMVIIAVFVYQKVTLLITTSHQVTFTYVAIDYGNKLAESLVNMETGERGFVITGKEDFLEPYRQGQKQFADVIVKAKQHVSGNSQQVAVLDKIKVEVERWQQEVTEVVIQKKAAHQDQEVDDLIASEIGKKQTDEIRKLINEFMDTENQLLIVRNQEAEQAKQVHGHP